MNSQPCSVRFKDPLQGCWCCCWTATRCVPLRMASSGAIALWCQTVMRRVQGNTINTMARISLLFGISRIGYLAWHYLQTIQTDAELTPPLPPLNCSGRTKAQNTEAIHALKNIPAAGRLPWYLQRLNDCKRHHSCLKDWQASRNHKNTLLLPLGGSSWNEFSTSLMSWLCHHGESASDFSSVMSHSRNDRK